MEVIATICGLGVGYIVYLMGYCAGSCDQQKEYANRHSLTK